MNATDFGYGFRVVDGRDRERRLVDWQKAFTAHLADDERAENGREVYLSAFQFAADFRDHLTATGSTRDFGGPTWSRWIWFDIDRTEAGRPLPEVVARALADTVDLAAFIGQRWGSHPDELGMLTFFSGSKGFHLGIPTSIWQPEPSGDFHVIARHFAERLANAAGVVIDVGIYDRVRLLRAPNSRHPKTGLHKRGIGAEELFQITADGVLDAARYPQDVLIPQPMPHCSGAADDWQAATIDAGQSVRSLQTVRQSARLNAATLAFIRSGADTGDRHRMLYSAARNLAECACPAELAHTLLTPAARDAGLAPADIRRQIECGIRDGGPHHA
jgi:hypothetical protein